MSYKQYIQQKRLKKTRIETPDVEVVLQRLKAEEKKKKLVPVRISRPTKIMVVK